MVIGYSLSGPDNDSFLFEDGHGKKICEVLDFVENRENYITESFRIKRENYNFSYSYDSALIVSQKFKDFCFRNEYSGLRFYQLKKQSDLYLFKTSNTVQFDSKRRAVTFSDYNETCEKHNSIAGGYPVCLKVNEVLSDGIFRTDLTFGSGYEQSPIILIGVKTYEKMKVEKFNDIDFEQILTRYDWEQ